MKFSIAWLKDYLEITSEEENRIPEVLLQAGVEVESVTDDIKGFEIVKISRVEKHPNADRLNICYLEGKKEPIVCGAKNVRPNLSCILANLGTTVAGFTITEREIRGIKSCGMLCSADELGIGTSEGLYEVKEESIEEVFHPNGRVYEVSITPNRGDLMSVYGIARELSAFGLGRLKPPNIYSPLLDFIKPKDTGDIIEIDSDEVLSMYSAKLTNIKNNTSPEWMKSRMKEVGISSKNLIVDVTNYIAHSLGQPLHAFDADYVKKILVKKIESCTFVDLKQEVHQIKNMTMMISGSEYVSLPGIIGGDYGKSSSSTTQVLLESGNYSKEHIFRGRLIKKTQASKLFFHGIDPEMTKIALSEAAGMIKEIGGCEISKTYVTKEYSETKVKIKFEDKDNYLTRLGFNQEGENWTSPSWRHDILEGADLEEEILRLEGYNSVKSINFAPFKSNQIKTCDPLEKLRFALAKDGFYEVITLDFMSESMHKVNPQDQSLIISNPISDTCYALRNSILCNLVDVYSSYMRSNLECSGIFEIGKSFGTFGERDELGIAFCDLNTWIKNGNQSLNYLEMKKRFEPYINMYYRNDLDVEAGVHPMLDQVCNWKLDNEIIGFFGILNQECSKKYKIRSTMYLGGINLDQIQSKTKTEFDTHHAVITKDLSIAVPVSIHTSDILKKLKNDYFAIRIFDIYPDAFLDSERAVGIRLIFNQLKNVLTSEEINEIINRITKQIKEMGCEVR